MLLLVGVTVHGTIFQGTKAAIVDTESLVGEVDTAKANFQMVTKGRDHCTALKVDCSEVTAKQHVTGRLKGQIQYPNAPRHAQSVNHLQ